MALVRNRFESPAGDVFSYLALRDDSSGARPLVHFAHATGFNAETYSSLLLAIGQFADVYAMDLRGHGHSAAPAPPDGFDSWQIYADDLCAFLPTLGRKVILVGHSMGAVTSMAAAQALPQQVVALVLIEPVFAGTLACAALWLLKRAGLNHFLPLSRAAARRRNRFASLDDIVARYADKASFRDWPEHWLRHYVQAGFRPTAEGQYELRCAPAWESWSFSVPPHGHWAQVRRLRLPVLLLHGQRYSTISGASVERFKRLVPHADVGCVAQGSHFLPMENEALILKNILEMTGRHYVD